MEQLEDLRLILRSERQNATGAHESRGEPKTAAQVISVREIATGCVKKPCATEDTHRRQAKGNIDAAAQRGLDPEAREAMICERIATILERLSTTSGPPAAAGIGDARPSWDRDPAALP